MGHQDGVVCASDGGGVCGGGVDDDALDCGGYVALMML